ncbi:MAG: hypothetical protein JWO59_772 [Chloroflexi bacterium]|nr:hypothetical protein [Chloroflexota bacterium]
MNPDPTHPPSSARFLAGLWTTVKLLVVVVICVLIAILMMSSTQATETPARATNGSITPGSAIKITGAIPTPPATPAAPQDVLIPGKLIYVKGGTIYMLHQYDLPVPLAVGREPSVSPDGTHLAYVAFTKNYQDLMVLNIQQRTSTKLLDNNLADPQNAGTGMTAAQPTWADDGKSIFFSWSYPGSPYYCGLTSGCALPAPWAERTDLTVTRCPVTGPCSIATARSLTQPYFESGGDYEPAPRLADPRYLVYAKWQYQQARDNTSRSLPRLQALDLTNNTEVALTDPLDNVSEPVWSPNGRYLAFVKTSGDLQSSSIWIMAFHPPGRIADYTHAHLLVSGTQLAGHPVFSPDGKYLAYLQQAADGHLHIFIARIHLGPNPHIDAPQMVKRPDIVDGDHLAWTQ